MKSKKDAGSLGRIRNGAPVQNYEVLTTAATTSRRPKKAVKELRQAQVQTPVQLTSAFGDFLRLQLQYGNRFVQRVVNVSQRGEGKVGVTSDTERELHSTIQGGWIQRQEAKKADVEEIASAEAPGLSDAIVKEVQALLKAKKRQAALNVIVSELGKKGDIDLDLLDEKKMYYAPSVVGEGEAPEPGYAKDPMTGERKAKPTVVRLGSAAFSRGVSWLYTSIMHEYQHVLQFQSPGAKGTKGQVTLGWLIERQEVEAYAWECMNAEKTGLAQKPKLMRDTWHRLHEDHWLRLGKKSRVLLNDLYVKAHDAAEKVVGKKLPFKPAS
jgi:hypothetical protein